MSQKNNQTIAGKLERLEAILAWFESEEITIEESLKKYEEALALSQEVKKALEDAKNQVEVIKQKFST